MSKHIPPEDDLSKILFFSGLTAHERREILASVFVENYATRKKIISSEENNKDIFFVVEGEVEVSAYTRTKQKVHFQRVKAGEYFGEFSAIDGEPRSASVVALKNSRVIRMRQETFISLLLTHPRMAMQLMRRLVAIIRNSNYKIVDMSTLTVFERLYNYFIRNGIDVDTHLVHYSGMPSQSDLAAEIGATRETVSRAINKMIADHVAIRGDSNDLFIRRNVDLKNLISAALSKSKGKTNRQKRI